MEIEETINLRLVRLKDANFIYYLRSNKDLNKYISPTSSSRKIQEKWLIEYKKRESKGEEYYFIVVDKINNMPCGTVRLYNIKENEAAWGSFILNKKRPDGASYEVIEKSLKFAFENLNLKKVTLDVRKENKKAIYIYRKLGFKYIKSDDLNDYYEYINRQ